jgi:DUF2958 family protein
MTLLTRAQREKLIENSRSKNVFALKPVARLFHPALDAVWLLIKSNPKNPDKVYAIYNVGKLSPKFDYVDLRKLQALCIGGENVKCDKTFNPAYSIAVYAEAARQNNRITEDKAVLDTISQGDSHLHF